MPGMGKRLLPHSQMVSLSPNCPSTRLTGRLGAAGPPTCLPCQAATWRWFVGGGKGREKTKRAEMVNDCRFGRKIELEAFVVPMKIAHFLYAWTVGVTELQGIENK